MKPLVLPNVRKMIVPEPGFVLFDADLKGADAQVVAWEADDEDLKAAFRAGLDVHEKNAEDMLGSKFTSLQGLARKKVRKENKVAVHLTNYGGRPNTLAKSQGWTTHEAELFQRRWFDLHPAIKMNFHDRIRAQLESSRTLVNPFGFRRVFFDRIDSIFGEALAWIPQSTVALNTFLGAQQLEKTFWPHQLDPHWFPVRDPEDYEGIILQTHDSLTFQFQPTKVPSLPNLVRSLRVLTPYADPLYIPWDIQTSTVSWGDLRKAV